MAAKSGATLWRIGFLALIMAACGAPAPGPEDSIAGEPSLFAPTPAKVIDLPSKLREASGLTVADGGRVFSHNDERAVVREIDPGTGAILASYHVGDAHGDLRGDFEDIAAVNNGDFYLLGSDGVLVRFRPGEDGAQTAYEGFDTRLRNICEAEGLAWLAGARSLILACKQMHARTLFDRVMLYTWSPETRRRSPDPWLNLPMYALTRAAGVPEFHPSAVAVDPASGRILLLAGRERALVELSATGEVLTGRRLGAEHRKPEGLAVLADGSLLIVDEGSRNGVPGRLTRYLRNP